MSSENKIPSVIHFIHIFKRDFSLLNYLSVSSARHHHPDWRIIIHTDSEDAPEGYNRKYWNKIKDKVEIKIDNIPTEFNGQKIKWPQYTADLMRLRILKEKGGIYMDTDVIVLKPLDDLCGHAFTISGEGKRDGFTGNENTLESSGSISNACILSCPNHEFINDWLELLPEHWDKGWAHHAVVLPYKMLESGKYTPFSDHNINLISSNSFNPFHFKSNWLFEDNNIDKLEHSLSLIHI